MRLPSASEKRKRRFLVKLGPGVWVKQGDDGSNLCKVKRCAEQPVSLTPFHRGLCEAHFFNYADERQRCKQCLRKWAVDPQCDQLCEDCHPAFQQVTPFEAHVLEQVRSGSSPMVAVQNAMGGMATATQATRELKKLSESAKMLKKFKAAGLTYEYLFDQLKQNIEATQTIYHDGVKVDEVRDFRASTQALALALKVTGATAASKQAEQAPVNVNVAVLPPEEPRRLDAPIYTLDMPEERKADED